VATQSSGRSGYSKEPSELRVGTLCLCRGSRYVTFENWPTKLTEAEFKVLWTLVRNAGEPVARETLFEVLGFKGLSTVENRLVDVLISRIRKKLGDDGKPRHLIVTIHSVGYLLASELLEPTVRIQ